MIWQIQYLNKTIRLNVGKYTQIIGTDKQKLYDIWQILNIYFGSKKYTQEEMISFDYSEPVIQNEESIMSRNHFKFISIESINELVEQMTLKKEMILYDYLLKCIKNKQMISYIDDINMHLENLVNCINHEINNDIEDIFQIDTKNISVEDILLKQLSPLFQLNNQLMGFKFINHFDKFLLFLKILEKQLEDNSDPVLLVMKDISNHLGSAHYYDICYRLDKMSQRFVNMYVLHVETHQDVQQYITDENIEYINVVSEYVHHLESIDDLLERIVLNYPYQYDLTKSELLEWLSNNAKHLFTKLSSNVGFTVHDLTLIKVINHLYQFYWEMLVPSLDYHPLELQYLLTDK